MKGIAQVFRGRNGQLSSTRLLFLTGIVVVLVVWMVAFAMAQNVAWQASTGWTNVDGDTGTFTAEEQGSMIFYLRARKQGDAAARKYFGETSSGVETWSGDFAEMFSASGLGVPQTGEIWEVTVSQAYKNPGGAELDSEESAVALYQFPFAPDRTSGAPSGPVITE